MTAESHNKQLGTRGRPKATKHRTFPKGGWTDPEFKKDWILSHTESQSNLDSLTHVTLVEAEISDFFTKRKEVWKTTVISVLSSVASEGPFVEQASDGGWMPRSR